MSGGSLNYFYIGLEEHIGDFGDKELDDLVKDLSTLFYEREWYLSGDTNVGDWNEASDAFKKKWFTNEGRESRIKEYFDSCVNDMRRLVGIYNRCGKCSHWFPKEDKDGVYGRCDIESRCLMHRSENACENYNERQEVSSSEDGCESEHQKKKKKFIEGLDSMFSSVWDCKIDHPLWEDTIGDFMRAVIQLYDNIEGGV